MSKDSAKRTAKRKHVPLIAIVVLLFATGIAVAATAAPGPSSDVKSAEYGTTGPTITGPCATIQGPDALTCQGLQDSFNKAKKACKKKSGAAKTKCKKKVKAKKKKYEKYAADHQYKP